METDPQITGIAFTGYSVTDLARARTFYEGALGLRPSTVAGSAEAGLVEYEIGAGVLSITNRMRFLAPSPGGGVAVLEIDDLARFSQRLRRLDVAFSVPMTEGPSCHFAMVRDPDGNLVGLHQIKSATS